MSAGQPAKLMALRRPAPGLAPETEILPWTRWIWPVALGALALALRVYHLDFNGLRGDEFITLKTCRLGVGDLIEDRLKSGHFPTYFLGLKMWIALFGDSEFALRMPSALMGAGVVVFLALAAARLWGREAGAVAGLAAAAHPTLLWASQFARPYGMLFLCAAAAFYALVSAIATGEDRHWRNWLVWSALALVSQAMYLFMALGQGIVLLWLARRNRILMPSVRGAMRTYGLCLLIFGVVAYALLGFESHRDNNKDTATMGADISHYVEGPARLFWGDYTALAADGKPDGAQSAALKWILFCAAMALTAGAWFAERGHAEDRHRGHGLRPPGFALAAVYAFSLIVVLGLAATFFYNAVRTYQYFSGGVGGAVLLTAAGLAAIPLRPLRWMLSLAALAVVSRTGWAYLQAPDDQLREAVRYVAEKRKTEEAIAFCTFKDNTQLRLDYFGLPVKPVGFRLDDKWGMNDVAKLGEQIKPLPSFWLIVYEAEPEGAEKMLNRAAPGRFRIGLRETFLEAQALHYYREPDAAVSPPKGGVK